MPFLSSPANIGLLNQARLATLPVGGAGASGPGAPAPGLLGGFNNFAASNPMALVGAGLALLDRRQNATIPLSSAFQQGVAGSQIDMQRGTRNRTRDWLKKNYKLSDEDAEAALSNPAILSSYIKPPMTANMQDYQAAKDDPEYGKYLINDARRRAPKTLGAIPPGYEVKYDDEGNPVSMTPIPKSPAAIQIENRENTKKAAAEIVVQDIDRGLDLIKTADLPTTGIVGNFLQNVPGTAAHDISKLMDTVKSNASFDRLQEMRMSSPTGGALGSVSDTENKLLQAAIGSLEQSQDKNQFIDNMKRVKNLYLDIIHGKGNGPPREVLGFEQSGGVAPAMGTAAPALGSQPNVTSGGVQWSIGQ